MFLVDDGSSDNTQEVLRALLIEHPHWRARLQVLFQTNQGKSVALNNALARTDGDWIAFNDSDDTWHPQKLEWQFRALEENPDCFACFTDASYVNCSGDNRTAIEVGGLKFRNRIGRLENALDVMVGQFHGIYMQTVLVRADILAKTGGFDAKLRVAIDVDFLFRLALQTPFCYVNLPLVDIDRTPNRSPGLTQEFPKGSLYRLQMNEIMFLQWSELSALSNHRRIKRRIHNQIVSTRSAMANCYILKNDIFAARKTLAKALRNGFRLNLWLKWSLTYLAPLGLMKKLVQRQSDQGIRWRFACRRIAIAQDQNAVRRG